MPDNDEKSDIAFSGDVYQQIRLGTERIVNELLAVMRDRREKAVGAHLRGRRSSIKARTGKPLTEADLAAVLEIRMSHSTGFAHALLQGAVEAFEDHKAGLQILQRLIEVELAEVDWESTSASQATSAGSTSIN